MYHNYFFLKRLARDLNQQLTGLELLECFSQNKDELILGFANENQSIYLRANLTPQVGLIQIPEDFKRAKKNSISLYGAMIGQKVTKVFSFLYERSFFIAFENGWEMIFKMHGSRSNILISKENSIKDLFRNVLQTDLSIVPDQLDQELDLSRERFDDVEGKPTKYLPALGKLPRQHLLELGYATLDRNEQWQQMQTLLKSLAEEPIRIYEKEGLPLLSLLAQDLPLILETTDAIAAANEYYILYTKNHYLAAEKNKVRKPLEDQIKKTENYLAKTHEKLEAVKNQRGYDEIANIIMANLHQIPKGARNVTLHDFYADQPIEIKLNPEHTPQKSAENLYRKSKNQQLEINNLEANLKIRAEKLNQLKRELEALANTESIKEVRKVLPAQQVKQKNQSPLSYHEYTIMGYTVMVGKNSKANDELTLKVANKNDLWLHAKDVPGSHVVIRNQAGKSIPKDVLEQAAQLAAWFSKRKTDSLCPVIYTPKKFIRKRKGDPPGAVVVEKEDVIMVTPKNYEA